MPNPFFWGVGGVYDVLVQLQAVSEIHYPVALSLVLVELMGVTLIWIWRTRSRQAPLRGEQLCSPHL
jgi:hypothetical protein